MVDRWRRCCVRCCTTSTPMWLWRPADQPRGECFDLSLMPAIYFSIVAKIRAEHIGELIILRNRISGYTDALLVMQIVFAAWSYTSSCFRELFISCSSDWKILDYYYKVGFGNRHVFLILVYFIILFCPIALVSRQVISESK